MGPHLSLLLKQIIKWIVLFVTQFLVLAFRGIGFTAIMLVISIYGIFQWIWNQSDSVAHAWIEELVFEEMDDQFDSWLYWTIRIFLILLILICLMAPLEFIRWMLRT